MGNISRRVVWSIQSDGDKVTSSSLFLNSTVESWEQTKVYYGLWSWRIIRATEIPRL